MWCNHIYDCIRYVSVYVYIYTCCRHLDPNKIKIYKSISLHIFVIYFASKSLYQPAPIPQLPGPVWLTPQKGGRKEIALMTIHTWHLAAGQTTTLWTIRTVRTISTISNTTTTTITIPIPIPIPIPITISISITITITITNCQYCYYYHHHHYYHYDHY